MICLTLEGIEVSLVSVNQMQAWAHPRRIMLATDLTDLEYVLNTTIQQAKTYQAKLLIAHVLQSHEPALIESELVADSKPVYAKAQIALDQAVALALAAGVPCSSRLLHGEVVYELEKAAVGWRADRVVAGSHGKKKFLLHILGSVAAVLFHRVEVPIFAIGPHAVTMKERVQGPMRILLGVAFDQSVERLVEFALSVAEQLSARISLVNVVPETAKAHPSTKQVIHCSETMLNGLLNGRSLRKSVADCTVVQGHPVEAILEYARQLPADLIILGASPHSAFNERFVPRTAYRVLCDSPCPVLVLKHESHLTAL